MDVTKSHLIKAVRQVLTNLGLSKELVREEMASMVKEYLDRYIQSDQFKRLVERCVVQHVRTHGYEFNCNVKEAVAAALTKKVKITVADDEQT